MKHTPIPPLSLIFGYGPALFLLLIALLAWLLPPRLAIELVFAGQLWAGAILLFLAGVRRGASFFTAGGPRLMQMATMIWLFVLGLATLVTPLPLAFMVAAAGFLSIAVLDPPAARRGEVPEDFGRLRPPQMAIFVVAIAALAIRTVRLA